MDASIESLFEYARSAVTDQDIIDCAPGDPGYGDYVRLWKGIRRSGSIPQKSEFDLSEVICLTGWANPEKWKNPGQLRTFRRFTSAVEMALLHAGDDSRSPVYLARDLIVDLDPSSKRHLRLLLDAFNATRVLLGGTRSNEVYPFFTFGSMILAQKARDWREAEEAATQLIKEENDVRNNDALNWAVQDESFLLGLTGDDLQRDDWISFAKGLKNPNKHGDVQHVIDAMIQV